MTTRSQTLLLCDAQHPKRTRLLEKLAEGGRQVDERTAEAALAAPETLPADTDWILAVDDATLPAMLQLAAARRATIGLVPGSGSLLPRLYDLPKEPDAQIDLAVDGEPLAIDLTRCNEEIVLGSVAIGDVPFLDHRGRAFLRSQSSVWRKLGVAAGLAWTALRHLFAIHPTSVNLSIGDEPRPRRTALTGVMVVENDIDRLSGKLFNERLSARDARLSVMLMAPASVMSYLALLMRVMSVGGRRLPRALSFVRTGQLVIEARTPLDYRLDGRRRRAERIEFRVEREALRLRAGTEFAERNPATVAERDTLSLQTLPENELRLASISKRLPLFTHALEEDFKELFQLLRANAAVTPDFVMLMVGSTLLAGLGLILDSPAVIIGAMVLAPLMAPIVSLAMGVLRRDFSLLKGSAQAIGIGIGLSLVTAALLAAVLPLRPMTGEIEARVHPSLLDLAVAVVSGIAAAYAHARESVMKSLPGVAIAVALVPPLAVSGIGLGWGDMRVAGSALLLFLTNLVGIAGAAALTFLVLGYAPIRTAAAGLRWLGFATAALALPLTLSLQQIVEVWRIETGLRGSSWELGTQTVQLSEPRVSLQREQVVIRATVTTDTEFDSAQARALKSALQDHLQRPVRLELQQRWVE